MSEQKRRPQRQPSQNMGGGPRGPRAMGPRQPINKESMKRLMGYVKPYWPRLLVVMCCIILNAVATAAAATFLGTIIDDHITPMLASGSQDFSPLLAAILRMAALYLLAIAAVYVQARIMAVVSQSVLRKVRDEMFDHMQTLPIRYFDTHTHGEVMSHYTNDTDTLRQMVSQVLPQSISSIITLVVVLISMLRCSVWLTILIIIGTMVMLKATMKIGSGSAKYFVKQQTSLASLNGYIEEMVNGQKVVKVFNHEPEAKEEFDELNDELTENATEANKLGNILGPVNNNMGHLLYVVLAIAGGAMAIAGMGNLSLAGMGTLTLGNIAAFLTLSRNFMQPINQMAQQINFIAMAVAGAARIFALMDEAPEADAGYVHLVNAREVDGELVETEEHTGLWAWKHPHSADGSVTYTRLSGDVVMEHVDFAYEPEKPVLHDINGHIRHYRPRTRYLPSTGNTLRAAAFRHPISRNTSLTVSATVNFKSSKYARATSLEETETVERSIGRLTSWVGPAPERLSNMTVKQVVGSRTPPFLFPGFTRNLSKPASSQITGSSPNVFLEHTCFRRERMPLYV